MDQQQLQEVQDIGGTIDYVQEEDSIEEQSQALNEVIVDSSSNHCQNQNDDHQNEAANLDADTSASISKVVIDAKRVSNYVEKDAESNKKTRNENISSSSLSLSTESATIVTFRPTIKSIKGLQDWPTSIIDEIHLHNQ